MGLDDDRRFYLCLLHCCWGLERFRCATKHGDQTSYLNPALKCLRCYALPSRTFFSHILSWRSLAGIYPGHRFRSGGAEQRSIPSKSLSHLFSQRGMRHFPHPRVTVDYKRRHCNVATRTVVPHSQHDPWQLNTALFHSALEDVLWSRLGPSPRKKEIVNSTNQEGRRRPIGLARLFFFFPSLAISMLMQGP